MLLNTKAMARDGLVKITLKDLELLAKVVHIKERM
jgi:hypothetical protein